MISHSGSSGGSEEEERSSSQSQEEGGSPPILVPQAAAAENVGGGASSADAAAGISCLELDAWIRDDDGAMDCMMMLPEMPMEGDSTSPEDSSMHAQDCCEQFDPKAQDDEMIFCRSSSSCSSTFPDSCGNQETLELSLSEDFFGERQAQAQAEQILPPLAEARYSAQFVPDLKKIIVKKPVMDKAVERLGGGRRGAMRLWNIIQVWLKHQQQGGTGFIEGLALPLESIGGFVNTPMIHQQQLEQQLEQHHHVPQQQQQQQQHPVFAGTGYGYSNALSRLYMGDGIVPGQFSDVTTTVEASRSAISPSSSAAATTRAARKSRMARQRRHRGIVGAVQSSSAAAATAAGAWSSSTPSPAAFLAATTTNSSPLSLPTTQAAPGAREQPMHNFGSCRDGIKAPTRMSCEKSIKFLLQKELKPSDVGNLGRIVLPKDNENKA